MSRLNNWFCKYTASTLKRIDTVCELSFYDYFNMKRGEEYGNGVVNGSGDISGHEEHHVIHESVPNTFEGNGKYYTDWCGNSNGSDIYE